MKICCISDTHERHKSLEIPVCDLLLHAGDITMMGEPAALVEFHDWCVSLLDRGVARKIIVIAGNHDFLFERDPEQARSIFSEIAYLQDSGTEWEGIHIYGTPWQPWFYDWAFNLRTEDQLRKKFELIPEDTEILLSHGPPKGILDQTTRGLSVGSGSLLERIQLVKPKMVVFGHIHESYGIQQQNGILYVNASSCDSRYRAVQKPLLLEL